MKNHNTSSSLAPLLIIGGACIAFVLAWLGLVVLLGFPTAYITVKIFTAHMQNANIVSVMKEPLMIFCEILFMIGVMANGITFKTICFIAFVCGVTWLFM